MTAFQGQVLEPLQPMGARSLGELSGRESERGAINQFLCVFQVEIEGQCCSHLVPESLGLQIAQLGTESCF